MELKKIALVRNRGSNPGSNQIQVGSGGSRYGGKGGGATTEHTVQITFIFIGQTRLVFGKRVCTCVTKHSNAFPTFLNWLKNSKRVLHEPKLHISRLPLFANFDL